MPEGPFVKFLEKTKHKDFSKDVYEQVLKVFEHHGLKEKQIRAFLWGSIKDIEALVAEEYKALGVTPMQAFSYGPPRPNVWPGGTGGGGDPHS
ncbi:MAG TPA: hypothetical protein VKF82_06085 [Candidatus Eremiobacteraceae bacterium]|nr:hypothetical protein [Candidatus Eremiobacteraceae bacterium]